MTVRVGVVGAGLIGGRRAASAAGCRRTAKTERAVSGSILDFAGAVTNSPFLRWDSWTIGTLRGTRRVCAYLYATKADSKPLLTATATYRVR